MKIKLLPILLIGCTSIGDNLSITNMCINQDIPTTDVVRSDISCRMPKIANVLPKRQLRKVSTKQHTDSLVKTVSPRLFKAADAEGRTVLNYGIPPTN